MMNIAQVAEAIEQFKTDLKNSCDDRDRKDAIKYLAAKTSEDIARSVAASHGLTNAYYFA